MIALFSLIKILAPSLLNSATCINLFSKILSVIELRPLALHNKTMNWACKSVGKFGYSLVIILLIFLIFLGPLIWISFFDVLILAPVFFKILISVWIILGLKFFIFKSPFEIVAATQNVPVSILSPITEYLVWFKDSTPIIWHVLFPIHLIFAPPELRKFVKSLISGSIAQFFRVVLPLARQEAIIVFSVAPTLILENLIWVPLSLPFELAWM